MNNEKLKRISARYLLNYTTEQLWDILCGKFILIFDDGYEIETNYREVLFSSYFWEFHRKYPNTPLLYQHHVQSVLNGKALTSKTHIELFASVYWSVTKAYNITLPEERSILSKMVYENLNYLYNSLTRHIEASVVSIDILDFIEVVDHNAIKPPLDALNFGSSGVDTDYGRSTIDAAYKKIANVLNNDPTLSHNAIARAVRAKMVNLNQVLQCVGPRGFLTDVDSIVMPVPVLRSYTQGMRTLYNTIVESRSAAKSLYFSESPLQDSEYFARRLQLMCMVVETLHYTDCGTNEYLLWRVKPPVENHGKVIYPGDVKFLIGKYYLDDISGQLKEITAADTHLFNKVIRLRSVIHCKHPDPHGVCAVCFGKLSDNITREANLGHICAATMTQQTSQSVLSNKHLDASSNTEPITLSELGHKFFTVGKNGSTFLLKPELKTKARMIVSSEEAFGLTDILLVPNIHDINPSRISKIDYIGIEIMIDGITTIMPICVSQDGRFAMLTLDFLAYLKLNKWDLDSNGNFIFSLQSWDFSKPIMCLPEMEYSYSIHSHQIAELIESRMKEISDRMKPGSPAATLTELFDLVNAKLNVNLALLEVILYATMIFHGEQDNFDLSRNSPNRSLGVSDMTLRNRSLSAAYSYERQLLLIVDPRSFFKENRPDSVFDAFLSPKEVIEHYKLTHQQY